MLGLCDLVSSYATDTYIAQPTMIIIVTNLPIRNQTEICDFLELTLPVQIHRQIFPRFPYPRSENNEIIFSNGRF